MKEDNIYSKNTQKVLAFLCDHATESFYSNQIAAKVHLSTGGVSQTLRLLSKERLLISEKKGKMLFYQIASSPVVRQFKVLRTVLFLNPLIQKLQDGTDKIILFGSCAQGVNIEDSDIDLLVVSRQKTDVHKIYSKFRSGQKIQLILKTPQEYVSLEKTEPIFFAEIEKGVSLWQKV